MRAQTKKTAKKWPKLHSSPLTYKIYLQIHPATRIQNMDAKKKAVAHGAEIRTEQNPYLEHRFIK
jgi:hypothetical protein